MIKQRRGPRRALQSRSRRAAVSGGPGLPARLGAWLEQHREAAHDTLRQLLGAPFPTAMTVAAIAIALALPAALHALTENLRALGGDWDAPSSISLFLRSEVDEARAEVLARELRARGDIAQARVISRAEGLAEFRAQSGLGSALDQLVDNPLPVVIALLPAPHLQQPDELEHLARELERLPETDFARMDTEWIRRLQALLGLLRQALWLLVTALALAVLLTIGNTVRLEIENRRGEIEVMDLVGATAAFIRRPFLYLGAWYGLFGGVLAWLLVTLATLLLQGPADQLARLYHSEFHLVGLDAASALTLILGAGLLGILGSWLVVARHLRQIAPPR